MKKITHIFNLCIISLAFLLSSCHRDGKPITETTPVPSQTKSKPALTSTPTFPTANTYLEKIQHALAKELGVGFDQVQFQASEEVDWPDSCLGAPTENEACAEVITPGYVGVLVVKDTLFEFHSDKSGDNVRFIPGVALVTQQRFVNQLGIEPTEVKIALVEKAEWQDSCLGLAVPGETCSQGIVPGYKIHLETNEGRYIYHSDQKGNQIRLANAPKVEIANPIIVWLLSSDNSCESAVIGLDAILIGSCRAAMLKIPFLMENPAEQLASLQSKYLPFEALTPAGKVSFSGTGKITATPSEQRMIAELAKMVSREITFEDAGASGGLIFTWQRQSNSAEICEMIAVYADGMAYASSCQKGLLEDLGKTRLSSTQLRTLYAWSDTLQAFEHEYTDSTTEDTTTIRLMFTGNGHDIFTDLETNWITGLAEEIYSQLSVTPNLADLESARQALQDYFASLADKRYDATVTLFGGSYEVLQNNNPSLDPEDHAALLKAGCALNGFVCNLQISNIVHEIQLSETDFRFTVEFVNPDGNLFMLGPCCGADPQEEPPWSQFDFLVKKVEGKFLVQDLPIYMP